MTQVGSLSYALPPAVAVATGLAIIAVVVRWAPSSPGRRAFVLMVAELVLWGAANLGMRLSADPGIALAWDRLVGVAIIALFLGFYHFSLEYANALNRRRALIVGYAVLAVFVFAAPTRLLVEGLRLEEYGYAPIPGPLAIPSAVAAVAFLFAGVHTLLWRYRTLSSFEERNRLLYMVVGASLPFVGALLDLFTNLPPVSIWTNILFCIICSIALLRYRLLDIPVFARRLLTYLVLGVLVAVPYVLTLFVLHQAIGTRLESFWASLLTVLFLALFLRPLYGMAQAVVDKAFYRERYEALRALERFSREAQHSVDLQSLAREATSLVVEALHATHAWPPAAPADGR